LPRNPRSDACRTAGKSVVTLRAGVSSTQGSAPGNAERCKSNSFAIERANACPIAIHMGGTPMPRMPRMPRDITDFRQNPPATCSHSSTRLRSASPARRSRGDRCHLKTSHRETPRREGAENSLLAGAAFNVAVTNGNVSAADPVLLASCFSVSHENRITRPPFAHAAAPLHRTSLQRAVHVQNGVLIRGTNARRSAS